MTRVIADGVVVLVSACLLGVYCRYNGQCVTDGRVLGLAGRVFCIPVCPEQLGGLPTPREPVEWRQGRALCPSGLDVTEAFERGVSQVLHIAALAGARAAILQPRSPSCGIGRIYDGSFSGRLVPGSGLLAARLKQAGFELYTPDELEIGQK